MLVCVVAAAVVDVRTVCSASRETSLAGATHAHRFVGGPLILPFMYRVAHLFVFCRRTIFSSVPGIFLF